MMAESKKEKNFGSRMLPEKNLSASVEWIFRQNDVKMSVYNKIILLIHPQKNLSQVPLE